MSNSSNIADDVAPDFFVCVCVCMWLLLTMTGFHKSGVIIEHMTCVTTGTTREIHHGSKCQEKSYSLYKSHLSFPNTAWVELSGP